MDTEKIIEQLTAKQREAVTHIDGPLLVLAGAGSGKTRVITCRVAHLVAQGIGPEHILAVPFTNKAAAEMRARVDILLAGVEGTGKQASAASAVTVGTFHAFCSMLLRRFGRTVQIDPGFTILDEKDRLKLIKHACEERSGMVDGLTPAKVAGAISLAKGQLTGPDQLDELMSDFRVKIISQIYKAYEKLLAGANALDFDDLLLNVVKLLDDQQVRDHIEEIYQYVLIDEYQDTNRIQYLIAKKLTQQRRNICATGDPDQSIYAWRGAEIRNILEFEQDFPDARVVRLEQNYRSTKKILRAASTLIRCNKLRKEKTLWTDNPPGAMLEVFQCDDEVDEAKRIVDTIVTLHKQGRELSDFAVFCRVNSLLRTVEQQLSVKGIRYQLARGVGFYQRREIRDAIAYLRVLANPVDHLALRRIINSPTRGIGSKAQGILSDHAQGKGISFYQAIQNADELSELGRTKINVVNFATMLEQLAGLGKEGVAQIVRQVIDRTGLRQFYAQLDDKEHQQNVGEILSGPDELSPEANLDELISTAVQFDLNYPDRRLEDFLAQSSLVSAVDSVDAQLGAVMLMTLHSAKGLEFPVVFIMAMEDGILPHAMNIEENSKLEEERRLMFVGITRAREQLYLSFTDMRTIRGRGRRSVPSRFLKQIDPEVLTGYNRDDFGGSVRPTPFVIGPRRGSDQDEDAAASALPSRPKCRFKINQRVYHPKFGHGRIDNIQLVGNDYLASVQFQTAGLRKLVLKYAPLEPVKLDE